MATLVNLAPYFVNLTNLKFNTTNLEVYSEALDALEIPSKSVVLGYTRDEFYVYIHTAARLCKSLYKFDLMDSYLLLEYTTYFNGILLQHPHGDFDWPSWTFEEIMKAL
jgi:hypothetical protein